MRFAVDRIEDNIVVLQKLDTKEIIEIEKCKLPFMISDGTVLKLEDGIFLLDTSSEEEIRNRIREKMERLKNN